MVYRHAWVVLLLVFALGPVLAQTPAQAGVATSTASTGALHGKVFDERGLVMVGAAVTVVDANDAAVAATVTGEDGSFSLFNVPFGTFNVRAASKGFETQDKLIELKAGEPGTLEISLILKVAMESQEVTVTSESKTLSLQAEENAGALVIKGDDLDALPDDPDELADALQALAGPSAGPDGAQFYIDGFSGGKMPTKASIREIRINQNPFSSEFERLGFGRIEILTKPGTDQFRGEGSFNFNDEALNSRHPYAITRAPFQARVFGGSVSGPLVSKKASFFVDVNRREMDENAIINARILDSALNPVDFNETIVTPQRRTEFAPRLDYQINDKNTLVGRYQYERSSDLNGSVGGFSLASQETNSYSTEHSVSLTETAIIKNRIINESRVRYQLEKRRRQGDSSLPTLRVLDSFYGGGSNVGLASNTNKDWEFQNTTAWASGRHSVKVGMVVRSQSIADISPSNFAGTFTFGGETGPELDATNQVILGTDGQPVLTQLSSLERYRRTLLFQSLGMSGAELRALGGGATQFTLAGGDPLADVHQVEVGTFINDDWRMRSDLLLSTGLRYETQTNISDHLDWAPRVALAWSPGAKAGQRPKTVVRGGFGLFYDRVGENMVLEADRYNGVKQQQFIVMNPDFFPTIPSVSELTAAALPQAVRRLSNGLSAPYSMQAAISVERQLPGGLTVSTSYVRTRRVHDIRMTNINAPLPETGIRPLGDIGNVFEYDSNGRADQNQLIIGVNNRFGRRITIFSNYALGKYNTDSDSGTGDPINPYNFANEWGRAGFDVRHRLVFGGSFLLPGELRLNPFVIATSGRPFNITTGRDTNGDTMFTERPAFATDLTRSSVIVTPLGAFDTDPLPGATIVSRNYAEGPGFVMTRLRLSRTFGFGKAKEVTQAEGGPGGPPPGMWAGGGGPGGRGHGGPGGGPGGGGRGGFGGFGGGSVAGKRYALTFSVDVSNILNHTNAGTPIGNLTSPLFGISNSALSGFGGGRGGGMGMAGNRRIDLQLRFSF